MTIIEMHKEFRLAAQQMGMQVVRNIMPDEIDILLNQQIITYVRNVVSNNLFHKYQEDVSSQNNGVSSTNAIASLVTKRVILINRDIYDMATIDVDVEDIMFVTSVYCNYDFSPVKYKFRIVDIDRLHQLNLDYCTKPTADYPVCAFHNDSSRKLDISIGSNNLVNEITINYIKLPNVVKYDETNPVNCDLPEYVHSEIINAAAIDYLNKVNNVIK